MKFHYDPQGDALYIRFNHSRYFESDEVSEGIIFDLDRKGQIIGIEILDASEKFPKEFRKQLLKNKSLSLTLA